MRIRENRPTIQDSISKTLEVEGREQMVRHIFDTLRKKGVVVTDSRNRAEEKSRQLCSVEVESAYGLNK